MDYFKFAVDSARAIWKRTDIKTLEREIHEQHLSEAGYTQDPTTGKWTKWVPCKWEDQQSDDDKT